MQSGIEIKQGVALLVCLGYWIVDTLYEKYDMVQVYL